MDEVEFKARTKRFALHVIEFADGLPRSLSAQVIGKQLLRSGTSVGIELSRGLSCEIY